MKTKQSCSCWQYWETNMAEGMRIFADILSEQFDDDSHETKTSIEQIQTEESMKTIYKTFQAVHDYDPDQPKLHRVKHLDYLRKALSHLTSSYQCLDSSRPWLCYWILHSLHLLGETFTQEVVDSISDFLSRCQNEDGGFGGGPGQLSHLAPTYAAVCALITLGDEKAYSVINRIGLKDFLKRVKQPNGSFAMHVDGEIDIRGAYCAIAVARLTNVYDQELFAKTVQWVVSCQSYEGGFSGCPGMEAHGGYTYCGFAALVLLKSAHYCDVNLLMRWCVNRQMRFEGGFQGRANKLVDGCYSFWQGALFALVHYFAYKDLPITDGHWLFDQEALQEYILICCQHNNGGCIDKPTKDRDLYHTCYALSGLSVAQHALQKVIIGDEANLLQEVHPSFNIGQKLATTAAEYYLSLTVPS